jgi:hypothetical protein
LLCNLSNRDAEPICLWSSIIGATTADIYRLAERDRTRPSG